MDKKLRKSLIITLITIVILGLMVTSAYFAVTVSNTNNEKINSTSGKISLIYTDCASSKQSDCANMTKNLAPEESIEKTFKVRNTGTEAVDYKIIFKQLTNTFQNGDLVYTIKDLSDNVLQSERPVPYATTQITNVNAFLDTIEANTTKEFKIVVKLKETTDDQTENASATYSIKLGLSAQNGGTDNILNLVRDTDASSTDVITKTAPSGSSCTNTFAYDGTVDNNLRYVGADPCNYVTFNNELWRIIGIMNNIDDGAGNIETRIKLVRKDSLGNYSWDTSDSSSNSGWGFNDWSDADLMRELNGDYLNTSLSANTTWYNGRYNNYNATFDYTKGLKSSSQDMIDNTKWNLGGMVRSYETLFSNLIYKAERGSAVYTGRPLTWTGKIALMYSSDYAYSTSGGNSYTRNECLYDISMHSSNSLSTWANPLYSDCKNNSWLYSSEDFNLTLTPSSSFQSQIFIVSSNGDLYNNGACGAGRVYPALHLKSNIKIKSGEGTPTNPYVLS